MSSKKREIFKAYSENNSMNIQRNSKISLKRFSKQFKRVFQLNSDEFFFEFRRKFEEYFNQKC